MGETAHVHLSTRTHRPPHTQGTASLEKEALPPTPAGTRAQQSQQPPAFSAELLPSRQQPAPGGTRAEESQWPPAFSAELRRPAGRSRGRTPGAVSPHPRAKGPPSGRWLRPGRPAEPCWDTHIRPPVAVGALGAAPSRFVLRVQQYLFHVAVINRNRVGNTAPVSVTAEV